MDDTKDPSGGFVDRTFGNSCRDEDSLGLGPVGVYRTPLGYLPYLRSISYGSRTRSLVPLPLGSSPDLFLSTLDPVSLPSRKGRLR